LCVFANAAAAISVTRLAHSRPRQNDKNRKIGEMKAKLYHGHGMPFYKLSLRLGFRSQLACWRIVSGAGNSHAGAGCELLHFACDAKAAFDDQTRMPAFFLCSRLGLTVI
jgi:hypothetical protein